MKTVNFLNRLFITILIGIAITGCTHLQNHDVIYQTSTINSLLAGVYDGATTYGTVKKHGDFGLGTFNGLDGEMVGLEGEFYQIKVDGTVHPVNDSMKTPFVMVTFFEPDQSIQLIKTLDYKQLEQYLDTLLPSKNIFYAVKIEGGFSYIKARSVPVQHKPYPPLVEAVKKQAIFEFHDIEGTIMGFRSPDYVEGINVPGYHLHFIAKDRKAGGHLLDCRLQNVTAEIDGTHGLYMVLPQSGDFYKVDLAQKNTKELDKVEKEDFQKK